MNNPPNHCFIQVLRFLDKYYPDAIPMSVLLKKVPLFKDSPGTLRKAITDAEHDGHIEVARVSPYGFEAAKLTHRITEEGKRHLNKWLDDIPDIEPAFVVKADVFERSLNSLSLIHI